MAITSRHFDLHLVCHGIQDSSQRKKLQPAGNSEMTLINRCVLNVIKLFNNI